MNPHRVSVKLLVAPDPEAPVDLHPFIGLFHRVIQQGSLPGLLIDVADYSHVPDGPGVLLVGHDVDYALDLADGRAGLLVVRKRSTVSIEQSVQEALHCALAAARVVEAEAGLGLRFSTDAAEIRILDRLVAPNDDDHADAAASALVPVVAALYGGEVALARADADDEGRALTFRVNAPEAPSLQALLERLSAPAFAKAAAPAAAPQRQSEWDVTVMELAKLREEGAEFALVDVREPHEVARANLGGVAIPLGSLAERAVELDALGHIVVHCQSGVRSAKAVTLLRGMGFANTWNVAGGLLAWIEHVDPDLGKS